MTAPFHSRLRVCAVNYLNTVPLVWGMLHGEQRELFDLTFRVPAECADLLASGAADIAIAPSVEVARQGLELIPGAGIASRGAVRSILLVCKAPPDRIRILAADSSSRTSVVLARIVLAQRYGAEPRIVSLPPDLGAMLEAADAALIIGDPALRLEPSALPFAVLDLGEEWTALTNLPMVFAVWAGRGVAGRADLAKHFLASCRYGLSHIDDIARQEGPPRGLSEEFARDYFRRHVVNEFGEEEYRGLERFLACAREFGMLFSTGPAR